MSIGHDSGPTNDVVEIVGVQARQAAHGRLVHYAHAQTPSPRSLRRRPI